MDGLKGRSFGINRCTLTLTTCNFIPKRELSDKNGTFMESGPKWTNKYTVKNDDKRSFLVKVGGHGSKWTVFWDKLMHIDPHSESLTTLTLTVRASLHVVLSQNGNFLTKTVPLWSLVQSGRSKRVKVDGQGR